MRNLIVRPEDPWTAFWNGAGGTALALGIPLTGAILFRIGMSAFWMGLGFSLGVTAAASLLAGLACALWSLVQQWAYDRFTSGPFP